MKINLQYQLCTGNWVECGERTESFLSRCEQFNGMLDGKIVPAFRAERNLTRDEVISAIMAGIELRNDSGDWYANCRQKPEPISVIPQELVRCSCGHSVPGGLVMNASIGTSCSNCYDRMSF